jgi:magnesium chelatase subunit D
MSVLHPVYPFSALVGQEHLKRALFLNAINPRIGGVLIRGEKGTAKSTAVRGLAHLLPDITVVEGCPYSCAPGKSAGLCGICQNRGPATTRSSVVDRPMRLVELPVSASEDRVVGSLDLEHAIVEGQRRFEPGILAQVHRGLLYVDEVNLLDDHLVDLLLDAAAMGVNTVEREGMSVSHPSRFILVGTMNPEEGELRPQLLDRFGLAVEISGLNDIASRVAVIERRMAYEHDPASFIASWQPQERETARRILQACELLPHVHISPADMAAVASLVLEVGVDGHRADLTILETARTHAAWSGRTSLTLEDIRLAAELALPHRMRRQPFTEMTLDEAMLNRALERSSEVINQMLTADENEQLKKKNPNSAATSKNHAAPHDTLDENHDGMEEHASSATRQTSDGMCVGGGTTRTDEQTTHDRTYAAEDYFRIKRLEGQYDRKERWSSGRRSRSRTMRKQGRYVSSRRAARVTDLAFDATLREAAPYQRQRQQHAATSPPHRRRPVKIILSRDDLRQKIRVRRTRNAVCFVVDASWSMAADERMHAVKMAILALLRDAYQCRDRVGLVSFQRDYAKVLLPLTSSVEMAQQRLQSMPTGGKTPLARGMLTGYEVVAQARWREPEIIPMLVLITDAQANVAINNQAPQAEAYQVADFIATQDIRTIIIDTELREFERGLARQLAERLKGQYYRLEDLSSEGLAQMVRTQMRS